VRLSVHVCQCGRHKCRTPACIHGLLHQQHHTQREPHLPDASLTPEATREAGTSVHTDAPACTHLE
jgi:hypothetical protein